MKKSTLMTEDQYQAFVRKSSTRVAEMSADERRSGSAAPEDGPLFQHIRTILFALEAGIRTRDWTCVGDGLVMTMQVLKRMEQPPHNGRGH